MYLGDGIAGVLASRAQWRFGIFPVGLQMAIKLKTSLCEIDVWRLNPLLLL